MDELKRIQELEAELKELKRKVIKPQTRYIQQKCQADQRGIEWLFTFDTWWKMWQESGQWSNRGRKTGQYCMARRGDVGPYSPTNVEIILITQNSRDAHTNGRVPSPWNKGKTISEETKEKIRIARAKQIITEETKEKLRQHNTGRPWTEARRQAYLANKA